MARNEEKHYGRLNRLYLLTERKKLEEAHPKRPKLDSLQTIAEVQKWLPSIKQDLDFYLKKSQVTCYSDTHIEECREKIVKLEKEYKSFVSKIKQLSPDTTDPIPWTSRGYKRKHFDETVEVENKNLFEPIACPILEQEKPKESDPPIYFVNVDLMDKPLSFNTHMKENGTFKHSIGDLQQNYKPSSTRNSIQSTRDKSGVEHPPIQRIVEYESSSDSDSS